MLGLKPMLVRRLIRIAAGLTTAAGLVAIGGATVLHVAKQRLGPPPVEAAAPLATIVLDRNDRLLRAFTTTDGRWRLPLDVKDVDPCYFDILLAFEDRRFREHHGVDWWAFARSASEVVRHRRMVSGGSTLTMQVARLLEGRHERTASGKFRQMVRALQLEEKLSKDDILRLYLRLAPFGGNIEGVRAASLAYFGKEPKRLSVAEAALLVALPQSPENRRPDRSPETARTARDRVLATAVLAGALSEAEAEKASTEPVPTERRAFPKFAPHLSESELAAHPESKIHRLTLDRDLQSALEDLALEHSRIQGAKLSTAILALDHSTGEILAHVGSADYLDETRWGAIDMVTAVRSPGSTLKPLIYGLAFEAGLAHPETLIEDRPVRFGTYAPKNFDDDFHGTVTVREALAESLNIPAVKTLNAVGPGKLVGRMRRFGVAPELPANTEPNVAIALGGLGLTLKDLATLYAGIARGGERIDLRHRQGETAKSLLLTRRAPVFPRRLLTSVAAWYVTDMLKDAPPPTNAAGGRIAYKTGTSYGYRDAWAVGFDGKHTIAVWVGRPDGTSTPGLAGRTSAAPLLFDAFQRIAERRAPLAAPPVGALQVAGSALPPPLKRFREPGESTAAGTFLEPPVLIAFPPDRAEVEVEAAGDDADPVMLKAEGGALPLTWLIDGAPIASDPHRRDVVWQPDGRGFKKLSVIDAKGQVDRVTVRLK